LLTRARAWWADSVVPGLRAFWGRHGTWVLGVGAAYMVVAAIGHHAYALPRLLAGGEVSTALDLQLRHAELQAWFAGRPVYGVIQPGDYPPASYVMLWPLLGWLTLDGASWAWAVSAFMLLGVIGWVSVAVAVPDHSSPRTAARWSDRWMPAVFLALISLSIYPTQWTVFLGQLGIHVIAFVVLGFYLLDRGDPEGRPGRDLAAAALLTLALVKPTLSVPFFWVAAFRPRGLRVAGLIVLLYAALSLLAGGFQPEGPLTLARTWLEVGAAETRLWDGMTNAHRWLTLAGWEGWAIPVSLMILVAHGVWTCRHRRIDPWILLAVAALVARLWIHHRPHDDILLIIPMVALFRIASRGLAGDASGVAAGLLFAGLWAQMHIPIWAFRDLPAFVPVGIEVVQTVLWLVTLGFFLAVAGRLRAANEPGGETEPIP